MNALFKYFIAIALLYLSSNALAETVCIKNKLGVIERWQVIDKSSITDAVACPLPSVKGDHQKSESSKDESAKLDVMNVSGQPNLTIKTVVAPSEAPKVNQPISEALTPTIQSWSASASDVNMRKMLETWAAKVKWTLVWSSDKDIPIETTFSIKADFKTAVRRVLEATALSDITLKPCFYTNNVVRVVRETAKCNPNE